MFNVHNMQNNKNCSYLFSKNSFSSLSLVISIDKHNNIKLIFNTFISLYSLSSFSSISLSLISFFFVFSFFLSFSFVLFFSSFSFFLLFSFLSSFSFFLSFFLLFDLLFFKLDFLLSFSSSSLIEIFILSDVLL